MNSTTPWGEGCAVNMAGLQSTDNIRDTNQFKLLPSTVTLGFSLSYQSVLEVEYYWICVATMPFPRDLIYISQLLRIWGRSG